MREIHLYVEGGGDKFGRARLREAFSRFLSDPRTTAYARGIQLRVVPSGSREDAYRAFRNRIEQYPGSTVFLLVDSDQKVDGTPLEHLGGSGGWDLSFAYDEQCHLMAQVMESWFLADPDALQQFYGKDFVARQIPKRKNVEEVPKDEVMSSLDVASRKTQKGRYHKIQHGPQILESLDPDRVRGRAPHCDRLFDALDEAIT